jgi:hypothetical protein
MNGEHPLAETTKDGIRRTLDDIASGRVESEIPLSVLRKKARSLQII